MGEMTCLFNFFEVGPKGLGPLYVIHGIPLSVNAVGVTSRPLVGFRHGECVSCPSVQWEIG